MRIASAVVASTSGGLTVYLDGATSPIEALAIQGQSLGSGNSGLALVVPGMTPIFIRLA